MWASALSILIVKYNDPLSSETLVLACPCPQHVTGHSWGQKPSSTRAPVCSVPPWSWTGCGLPPPCPLPCPCCYLCLWSLSPEPLIYTNIFAFKKAVREKTCYMQGKLHNAIRRFFRKLLPEWHNILKSDEIWKKKKSNQSQVILSGKATIQNWRREKELSRQAKAKETITTEPTL